MRTPVHADHMATRYRKRMSPVRNVQGKHSTAATGSATAQNASISDGANHGRIAPDTLGFSAAARRRAAPSAAA